MRKLLLILLTIFLIGCSSSWMGIGSGDMYIKYNKEFTVEQFDSICLYDTISNDLKDWRTIPLLDNEDKTKIERYMYIKKLTPQVIYILTKEGDKYTVGKRVTR